jgi:hypothetical protein
MSWQSEMESEKQRFRGLWAEHGGDYLYGDWLPLPPPSLDSSLTMGSVDQRIEDMFTKFSAGHLEEVQPILDLVEGSHRTLVADFAANAGGVRDHLDDWTGEGADRFRQYMRDMESAVELKENCLLAAQETIDAYRALLEEYHRAIDELIRNTDAALADVEQAEEDAQYQFAFGVAVAVVGIGAAVASGGLALGAAAGALAAVGAAELTAFIGGKEQGEVIVSMVDNGEIIIGDAEDAAARVRDACFQITTYLTTYNGPRHDNDPYGDNQTTYLEEIRPDRPDLITDEEFDPEEFRPEDATDGDVSDMSRDDLVQNPQRDDDDPRDRELRDPTGEQSPMIPTPPPDPDPYVPGEGIQPDPAEPVPAPDFYPEQGEPEPLQPEPIEGYVPPTT